MSRASRRLAYGATVMALAAGLAAPTGANADVLTFKPVADAHVDASTPTTSYGAQTAMWVDGSPRKAIYLRFDVAGVGTRAVRSAKLRLYQRDASPMGGRVSRASSTTWTESITWDTRPAIDGATAGDFGPVADGRWYELEVGPLVTADGAVTLAIDSADSDGARWQSRESSTPPELVLDVDASGTVVDGLSTVAPAPESSSDPTYYATQHRLARTEGGRLLTVYGRHASGVQLGWRDPGGTWSTQTAGVTASGGLLTGTGTGDWPASVVVGRDSAGVQRGWVVWAGPVSGQSSALKLVRLSDLDRPGGPVVGPTVTLDAIPGFRADLALEQAADGTSRAAVLWTRTNGESNFEVMTGWLSSLDTDTPTLTGLTPLWFDTYYKRHGTLVAAPAGVRAVVRVGSSRVRVWRHDATGAPTAWTAASSTGIKVDAPAAARMGDTLVVASEGDPGVVEVARMTINGTPIATDLRLSGYAQPSVAADGTRAWVVMVRKADGYVVSRSYDAATGWSASDRVEIGAEGGGWHQWPNVLREPDGRLRFVVRGPAGTSTSRSSTLAFQRTV